MHLIVTVLAYQHIHLQDTSYFLLAWGGQLDMQCLGFGLLDTDDVVVFRCVDNKASVMQRVCPGIN